MSFHFHPAFQVEEEFYGDAILTSLPMRLVQAGRLPGNAMLEPRGALWVAVTTGGAEIQIINTHLSLAPFERSMQVDALLGPHWISHPRCTEPVVLAGDFNAGSPSRVYRRLSTRLRDAQLRITSPAATDLSSPDANAAH